MSDLTQNPNLPQVQPIARVNFSTHKLTEGDPIAHAQFEANVQSALKNTNGHLHLPPNWFPGKVAPDPTDLAATAEYDAYLLTLPAFNEIPLDTTISAVAAIQAKMAAYNNLIAAGTPAANIPFPDRVGLADSTMLNALLMLRKTNLDKIERESTSIGPTLAQMRLVLSPNLIQNLDAAAIPGPSGLSRPQNYQYRQIMDHLSKVCRGDPATFRDLLIKLFCNVGRMTKPSDIHILIDCFSFYIQQLLDFDTNIPGNAPFTYRQLALGYLFRIPSKGPTKEIYHIAKKEWEKLGSTWESLVEKCRVESGKTLLNCSNSSVDISTSSSSSSNSSQIMAQGAFWQMDHPSIPPYVNGTTSTLVPLAPTFDTLGPFIPYSRYHSNPPHPFAHEAAQSARDGFMPDLIPWNTPGPINYPSLPMYANTLVHQPMYAPAAASAYVTQQILPQPAYYPTLANPVLNPREPIPYPQPVSGFPYAPTQPNPAWNLPPNVLVNSPVRSPICRLFPGCTFTRRLGPNGMVVGCAFQHVNQTTGRPDPVYDDIQRQSDAEQVPGQAYRLSPRLQQLKDTHDASQGYPKRPCL